MRFRPAVGALRSAAMLLLLAAPGDTVVGRAHAFVADGRVATPTASVRAWRVACGGQPGNGARP